MSLKKHVTKCNLGFSPKCCDKTVPTPDSKASTSTMKGLLGSGCLKIGAVVKPVLSLLKALLASGFQYRHLGPFFFSSTVNGVTMEPKPLCKPQEALELLDCNKGGSFG